MICYNESVFAQHICIAAANAYSQRPVLLQLPPLFLRQSRTADFDLLRRAYLEVRYNNITNRISSSPKPTSTPSSPRSNYSAISQKKYAQSNWFYNAGRLQYTLIALRRRNEAFTRDLVMAIKGCRLTVQEQKQLYSEQGLIKAFRKQDGTVYRSRFGVESKPGQKDMLTECVLSVQQPQEVKPQTQQTKQEQPQQKERPQVRSYPPKKRGRGI